MSLRLVTPPASEPISLAEAKKHLRLEESGDDAQVTKFIKAARQYIEKLCWRGVLVQTWMLTQASFRGADRLEEIPSYVPGNVSGGSRFLPFIELERGHLAATPGVAVTYLDESGAEQTLAPAAYALENQGTDEMCGRLWLNTAGGYSWPNVLGRFDSVKIQYTVGWTTADDVPSPLIQSMLLLISQMYEYRTPEVTGTVIAKVGFTIDALTAPYRLTRL